MGEEANRKVGTMFQVVRQVATEVDTIEEEVSATKKMLDKHIQEWKGWTEQYRNMPRKHS